MLILLRLAILTATVLLCARFIQGVKVKSIPAAVGVAVVFSVLNWLLGGILKVLFFLPAILTLGLLFLFLPLIVNAILLWLTDKALHVFEIENGKAHWLMALIITAVNAGAALALR
jgi:putative membrane protein